MIDRRSVLALSGAALAAATIARPHVARAAAPLTQPALPYAQNALEPVISARTVALHYGKHHKSYFDKLATLTRGKPYAEMELARLVTEAHKAGDRDVFNNAGQAFNHNLYWAQFEGGSVAPPDVLREAAERDFGGVDRMKAQIAEAADKVFGTGWVWLAAETGRLSVVGLQDAGNPITDGKVPLLGIDVWEHAYYIDYENRRTEHVKAVLDRLVNWRVVADRLAA